MNNKDQGKLAEENKVTVQHSQTSEFSKPLAIPDMQSGRDIAHPTEHLKIMEKVTVENSEINTFPQNKGPEKPEVKLQNQIHETANEIFSGVEKVIIDPKLTEKIGDAKFFQQEKNVNVLVETKKNEKVVLENTKEEHKADFATRKKTIVYMIYLHYEGIKSIPQLKYYINDICVKKNKRIVDLTLEERVPNFLNLPNSYEKSIRVYSAEVDFIEPFQVRIYTEGKLGPYIYNEKIGRTRVIYGESHQFLFNVDIGKNFSYSFYPDPPGMSVLDPLLQLGIYAHYILMNENRVIHSLPFLCKQFDDESLLYNTSEKIASDKFKTFLSFINYAITPAVKESEMINALLTIFGLIPKNVSLVPVEYEQFGALGKFAYNSLSKVNIEMFKESLIRGVPLTLYLMHKLKVPNYLSFLASKERNINMIYLEFLDLLLRNENVLSEEYFNHHIEFTKKYLSNDIDKIRTSLVLLCPSVDVFLDELNEYLSKKFETKNLINYINQYFLYKVDLPTIFKVLVFIGSCCSELKNAIIHSNLHILFSKCIFEECKDVELEFLVDILCNPNFSIVLHDHENTNKLNFILRRVLPLHGPINSTLATFEVILTKLTRNEKEFIIRKGNSYEIQYYCKSIHEIMAYINSLSELFSEKNPEIVEEFITNLFEQLEVNFFTKKEAFFLDLPRYFNELTSQNAINIIMKYLKSFINRKVYKIKDAFTIYSNPLHILLEINKEKEVSPYHVELTDFAILKIANVKPSENDIVKYLFTRPEKAHFWYYILEKNISKDLVDCLVESLYPYFKLLLSREIKCKYLDRLCEMLSESKEIFYDYMNKIFIIKNIALPDNETVSSIVEKLIVDYMNFTKSLDHLRSFFAAFCLPTFDSFYNKFVKTFENNDNISFSQLSIEDKYSKYLKIADLINPLLQSSVYRHYFNDLNGTKKLQSVDEVEELCKKSYDMMKENVEVYLGNPEQFPISKVAEFSNFIVNVNEEMEFFSHFCPKNIKYKSPQIFDMLKRTIIYYKNYQDDVSFCKNVLGLTTALHIDDEEVVKACNETINALNDGNITKLTLGEIEKIHEKVNKYVLLNKVKTSDLKKKKENQETFHRIAVAITNANKLIELSTNLKDDELRSLQQGVAEYTDSSVSRETVLDFIIWCYFLKHVMEGAKSYESLFNEIVSLSAKEEYKRILYIIKNCSEEISAIERLRMEIMQNQEAKRQRIFRIVHSSKFYVSFQKERKCWEMSIEFKIEKDFVKISHSEVLDLNNRAGIDINTEEEQERKAKRIEFTNIKQSENEKIIWSRLKRFIKIVKELVVISTLLRKLYMHGYPDMKKYKKIEFACENGMLNGKEIDEIQSELNLEQTDMKWCKSINDLYASNYNMTFLHGRQPWILEKYLIKNEFKEKKKAESLLRFMGKKLSEIQPGKSIVHSSPEKRIFQLNELINNLPQVPPTNVPLKFASTLPDVAKFYYISTKKLIDGLITLQKLYELSPFLPSNLLFCDNTTTKSEIKSFVYRSFMDNKLKMHVIVYPERLQEKCFTKMTSLLKQFVKDKFRDCKFRIAFLVKDNEAQSSRELKNGLDAIDIKEHAQLTDTEIMNEIKNECNSRTVIFESANAASGKTTKAIELAKSKNLNLIHFPITGHISISKIAKRLYKIEQKNSAILLQLDNISDIIDCSILLYQICILRCIVYHSEVVYIDSDVYIEFSNTVPQELAAPFRLLSFPKIDEFSVDKIEITSVELYVSYYLSLLYSGSIIQRDSLIAFDDFIKIPQITHENCIKALERFVSERSKNINGFVQFQIAMRILKYSLDALAKGPLSVAISECENIAELQSLTTNVIRRVLEMILLTTTEFNRRIVEDVKVVQDFTKSALKGGNEKIPAQIKLLSDDQRIISWEKTNNFVLIMTADGVWLPLYKSSETVPPELRNFILLLDELYKSVQTGNAAPAQIVSSIKNNSCKLEDLSKLGREGFIEKLQRFKLRSLSNTYDSNYVLTHDNTLKMALIYEKAMAGVPVIIIGETGCGKTALVRFLVKQVLEEDFYVLNLHAGVDDDEIINFMSNKIVEANKYLNESKSNNSISRKVWIFFDEFNTTDSIGLIKEIVCDRRMMGMSLPGNMVFVAACNQYKLKHHDPFCYDSVGIEKEILGNRLHHNRLEHFVHPLPETMLEYLMNFGSLKPEDERQYISKMLDVVKESWKEMFVNAVAESQNHFKEKAGATSVSLRDVRRFAIFYSWFVEDFTLRAKYPHEKYKNITDCNLDKEYRAALMALLFCYYLRIQKAELRTNYLAKMINIIRCKRGVHTAEDIEKVINAEQQYLLVRMNVPNDIALNLALCENIHTMFVCIMTRIPLFLIGKPGCSKSLAIQLLVSNLRGQDSRDPYFREINEPLMIYFQGSDSCTSEGILRVFERCEELKKESKKRKFVPVLVIDEIGLAENSPYNPLKVLHSKLEIDREQEYKREDRIAVIGISNWKLDSSKMNRAMYLARPDPDEKDLCMTAIKICKSIMNAEGLLLKYIECLSKAYFKFKNKCRLEGEIQRTDHFYGLRDFYYMIKQIARDSLSLKITSDKGLLAVIKKSIERNFGRISAVFSASDEIIRYFGELIGKNDILQSIPNTDPLELLNDNLSDQNARYVMLIGKGDVPPYILEHYLKETNKAKRIIMGSCFEGDSNQEQYSFNRLSEIIMYLEQNITLVLRGMKSIYSSLYDLFNQNFTTIGEKRYCRVAIGSEYNPRCLVNPNFRCIIFLDESDLHEVDPPFLNRFSKHYVSLDYVMQEKEKIVYEKVKDWINLILPENIKNNSTMLQQYQVFMRSSDDFLKILAIKSSSRLSPNETVEKTVEEMVEFCKKKLIESASLELLILIHTSKIPPSEIEDIHRIYNEVHSSNFKDILEQAFKRKTKKVIYTCSSQDDLLIKRILKKMSNRAIQKVVHAYRSEEELRREIQRYYKNSNQNLLLFHFDLQNDYKYLLFVQSVLEGIEQDYERSNSHSVKSVIFVLHSKRNQRYNEPESKLVLFEGWDCIMIDDINSEIMQSLDDSIYEKSTKELLLQETFFSIEEGIVDILEQSLFNLKYEVSTLIDKEDINRNRMYYLASIPKNKNLLKAFANEIRKNIVNTKSLDDWKTEIYNNPEILSSSETTYDAIKNYLEFHIEKYLMRILYTIENQAALNSFFIVNEKIKKDIENIWLAYFEHIEIQPELELVPLKETAVIRINFMHSFPFSFNEYAIYRKCFDKVKQVQDFRITFEEQLFTFMKNVENSTKLRQGDLRLINDDWDIGRLFWKDVIAQYSIDLQLEDKWNLVVEKVLEILIPRHSPMEKLFYLFYCEKVLRSFFAVVTYIEAQLQLENLYDKIGSLKVNLDESTPRTDNVFNQLLADIINQICISNVLNPEKASELSFLKYIQVLQTLSILIKDFSKATTTQIHVVSAIEFFESYGRILQPTLKEGRVMFIKAIEAFQEKKNNPEQLFEDKKLFTAIKDSCHEIMNEEKDALRQDNILRFLNDYYFEVLKVYPDLISDYLEDCDKINSEMWKYSNRLFTFLEKDFIILSKKFEDEQEFNNNLAFKAINNYYSKISVDDSLIAVLMSDFIAHQYVFSEKVLNYKDFILANLVRFKYAYNICIQGLGFASGAQRIAALGFCRKYLDAFTLHLLSNSELEASAILEINEILNNDRKFSSTLVLYICKKLLNHFKNSIVDLNAFLCSNLVKYEWMCKYKTDFTIKSALDGKLPCFGEYQAKVEKFSQELGEAMTTKFIHSAKLLQKMKEYLKGKDAIIVFLSFINTVYRAYASIGNEETKQMDVAMLKSVGDWLRKMALGDIDKNYVDLLMSIANNFPNHSLLRIRNYKTHAITDVQKVLLVTMISICIAYKFDTNPLSICFFEDGNAKSWFKSLAKYYVISAPYNENFAKQLVKLEIIKAGGALYACRHCGDIYDVGGCGNPTEAKRCQVCFHSIGLNSGDQRINISQMANIIENEKAAVPTGINLSLIKSKDKIENIRKLNAPACKLLNLFICANIYYFSHVYKTSPSLISNNFSNWKPLKEIIKDLFSTIQEILNYSEHELIIYSALEEISLIAHDKNYCYAPDTINKRDEFETAINNRIANNVLANVTQTRKNYRMRLENTENYELKFNSKIKMLQEESKDKDYHLYISFFRLTREANSDIFLSIYQRSPHKDSYPFIEYYVQNYEKLERLKALYPIIVFTNKMLEYYSRLYGRFEVYGVKKSTIFSQHPDLKPLYKKLKKAWEKYIEKGPDLFFECSSTKPMRIKNFKSLGDFLVDNYTKNGGFSLGAALYSLGKMQAEELKAINYMKNLANEAEFTGQEVNVQDLKEEDIININVDLTKIERGLSDPRYGMGLEVFYDFEQINKDIYAQFIQKKYVNWEKIRKVIFHGETFCEESLLLEEVQANLPQQSIANSINELKQFFDAKKKETKSDYGDFLRKIYISLETILIYAKNAKISDPTITLKDFSKSLNTKKIYLDIFGESLIAEFSLENIIELYEYVEKNYFPYYKPYVSIEYRKSDDKDKVNNKLDKFYIRDE